MVSRQIRKIDEVPVRTWLGLGAGAVFVGLLAALVHVLNDQVSQARLRQAQHHAAQTALSGCATSPTRTARSLCIAQANAGPAANFIQLADVELRTGVQPKIPGLLAGQIPNRELAGQAPGTLAKIAAFY